MYQVNINAAALNSPATASLPVEIVERKGIGHPDTICDALAEHLSVVLSRFYLDRFGTILHHNVDKALLCGGSAHPAFGGGEMLQPIDLFLAGRATAEHGGVKVPLEDLAIETSRQWLKDNIRNLDPQWDVRIHCLIRPSSADLVDLFRRQHTTGVPLANDTSYGVGYAPLDELETVVLRVERHLNAPDIKARFPEIGEDIKVMGARQGRHIRLTVACALVARHVVDMPDYLAKKARVGRLALEAAQQASSAPIEVDVNSADGDSADGIYLTVTGTSAEAGDDGEVGRGNRANGLITPYRPMSLEAVAGKNPISHVGKLYNIAADRIARMLVEDIPQVDEAYCCLLSRIGQPIDQPQVVDIKLRLQNGAALQDVQSRIADIVQRHLAAMGALWRELITGAYAIY